MRGQGESKAMAECSTWIWSGKWGEREDKVPTQVLFRKRIEIDGEVEKADLRISADSRYKLYVNGVLVEAGPCKGDGQIWFYDQVSIKSYLKKGENVLAAAVLRFPLGPSKGNQSMVGTHIPGLFLEGRVLEKGGRCLELSADQSWKCVIDHGTSFVREAPGFAPLHFYEDVTPKRELRRWKEKGFDDRDWEEARPYERGLIRDAVSPGNLNPRPIPYMRRNRGRFKEIMAVRSSLSSRQQWEQMLLGTGMVEIGPEREEIVEIHGGEELCGYLHLAVEGGTGARIRILQSESYVQKDGTSKDGKPLKADRLDVESGILQGYEDVYHPCGDGTKAVPEEYETFWFRTFRFIRLEIVTGRDRLRIRDFYYEETGYPLDIKTHVETSDSSLQAVWDISARTLRRCMHETYMDCPFYEQLQYVMDSRAQILFTYQVSMDDRLARKCMDDFKRAQRYDGLLCSAYPNTRPNVIPGFSIFYVWMLHDHMMYFGDKELIRFHMPAVEQVLAYFYRSRAEEGYVGKTGGFYRQAKFWSFIDWVPRWKVGVPNAAKQGAVTMESLLYLIGLEKAAGLAVFLGREEQAREYRKTAGEVRESVRRFCVDEEGQIMDGPGFAEYSQHCQVFGVLSGVLDKDTGRKNLLETLRNREQYAQCTVSMALYLFRALEITGLYEETRECWNIWRRMVDNHMTTVAESDEYPRSECHAWGALALYELPGVVLGIGPAAPGFEKIRVHPVPGYLDWARGEGITPKGKVYVEWEKKDQKELSVTVRANREVMERIVKEKEIHYEEE